MDDKGGKGVWCWSVSLIFLVLSLALCQTIGSDVCGMETSGLRLMLIMLMVTTIMMRVNMTKMETIITKRAATKMTKEKKIYLVFFGIDEITQII